MHNGQIFRSQMIAGKGLPPQFMIDFSIPHDFNILRVINIEACPLFGSMSDAEIEAICSFQTINGRRYNMGCSSDFREFESLLGKDGRLQQSIAVSSITEKEAINFI